MTSTAAITQTTDSPSALSRAAIQREDGGPFMVADWADPWMLHYRVDVADLAGDVPFDLDLFEGSAYVTVVAFSMRQLRLSVGGRLIEGLSGGALMPCSHTFLNVRTYVRWRGEAGIYFLTEWVPNRVARFFGPRTFGLPCRLGAFQENTSPDDSHHQCHVTDVASDTRFSWRATCADSISVHRALTGSLDHFLMERYTAFTDQRGVQRRFRVYHQPWRFTPAHVEMTDQSLLDQAWHGLAGAQLEQAVRCGDMSNVWMSRPHWIATDLT